jgi:hypothetical protein
LDPSLVPTQKKLAWKVDYPLSKWNVNNGQCIPKSKHNLRKKNPLPTTHPQEKEGGPFTPSRDFSLVAWKLILFLKLAATIFGLDR